MQLKVLLANSAYATDICGRQIPPFFLSTFFFPLQVDDGRLTADLAMGCAVTSIALCKLLLPRTHWGIVQVLSAIPWTMQDQEVSGVHRHCSSGVESKDLSV